MATIIIENVPDSVVKQYGTKINFSYDLSFDAFDVDFRPLRDNEITSEILKNIEEARKIPKSKLYNI